MSWQPELLNYRAVERYLMEQELPSIRFFIKLVSFYYVAYIFGIIFIEIYYYFSESDRELVPTSMSMASSRIIPLALGIVVYVYCLLKNSRIIDRRMALIGIALAMFYYLRVCVSFVAKLSDSEMGFGILFIWNFAEISFFTYLAMIAALIVNREKISKTQWKVFDILMMIFAFVAFTGTIMQKAFGDAPVVTAICLLLGVIAFAMKFSKLTCEYSVLKGER